MKRRVTSAVAVVLVITLATLLSTGCAQRIKDRTVVTINYTGTLEDGSVFDSSEGGEPLEFMVGVGMMIPGLEKGLMGMKVGETKRIEVKAADAYGERDETAIMEYPKNQFSEDMELEVGSQLSAQTDSGQVYATVTAIGEETVTLDFNFPLAGKTLFFDVEVVGIRKATTDELDQAAAMSQSN